MIEDVLFRSFQGIGGIEQLPGVKAWTRLVLMDPQMLLVGVGLWVNHRRLSTDRALSHHNHYGRIMDEGSLPYAFEHFLFVSNGDEIRQIFTGEFLEAAWNQNRFIVTTELIVGAGLSFNFASVV
jgi:hypothetical protein